MKLMGKILPFFTVLLGSIFSAPATNTPSDSIPFELGPASRIYVKGSVNGSRPLRFLFDTGATSMVINNNSLKEIPMEFNETVVNHGATGSVEVRKSTENRFSIGQKSFKHVSFVAIPYGPDQWDGVLGLWFIRQQVTEVNYADRKIYLYPHGSYTPPSQAIRLKMEYVMGNNLLKRFNLVYDSQQGYIYLIPNNLMYTPFYDCLLRPQPEKKPGPPTGRSRAG